MLTDTSTDDHGVSKITVNWGDNSVVGSGTAGGTFTHTYMNPGTYTITQKAIDTLGQQGTATYTATPAYLSIGGTVYRSNGTTPVPSATVTVKKAGAVVKTVYTAGNGTFSAGSLNSPLKNPFNRHPRESGGPESLRKEWIPASAGMTVLRGRSLFQRAAKPGT